MNGTRGTYTEFFMGRNSVPFRVYCTGRQSKGRTREATATTLQTWTATINNSDTPLDVLLDPTNSAIVFAAFSRDKLPGYSLKHPLVLGDIHTTPVRESEVDLEYHCCCFGGLSLVERRGDLLSVGRSAGAKSYLNRNT